MLIEQVNRAAGLQPLHQADDLPQTVCAAAEEGAQQLEVLNKRSLEGKQFVVNQRHDSTCCLQARKPPHATFSTASPAQTGTWQLTLIDTAHLSASEQRRQSRRRLPPRQSRRRCRCCWADTGRLCQSGPVRVRR